MLTRLKIRNFKAWTNTRDIRLAPVTVFFGPNSSGKSSIGQFLLMLRQTSESPDRQRVLHLGGSQAVVDLGTFEDIIHRHDDEKHLFFELEWEAESGQLRVDDPLTGKAFHGRRLCFSAEIGFSSEEKQRLVAHNLAYKLGDPRRGGLQVGMARESGKRRPYRLSFNGIDLKRNVGRGWPLPSPTRFYGFPDEVQAYYQNASFVQDLTLSFEQRLRTLFYLGPLRQRPHRQYAWSGEIPEHVGFQGERTVDAILAARSSNRKISPRKGLHYVEFDLLMARWLKEMGLIHGFAIQRISDKGRDYEVLVQTRAGAAEVSITDVGFGISQVLPVIVQGFYAPPDSTVIMEQPELHLHPSVQAALADVLISSTRAWENGKHRKTQLIIESHSEHFLRRLQLRIAEGVLSPEDTALYFCKSAKSGFEIEPLDVDLFGNIVNWPRNFFGDEVGDLVKMTIAAQQRSEERS